jgi:hypothetical protein
MLGSDGNQTPWLGHVTPDIKKREIVHLIFKGPLNLVLMLEAF